MGILSAYRNLVMRRVMRFLGRWFYGLRPDVYYAKDSDPMPCWHCGGLTRYLDLDFEAPLCSNACNDAKWQEYTEAIRRTRRGENNTC